jgi:plastocyanin
MKLNRLKIALAGLMTALVAVAVVGGARTQAAAAALPSATPSVTNTVVAEDKPAAEIKIDNFTFSPAQLTVTAGTTVRWVNKDDLPHNIVADDKSFKSKTMDTDEAFTYTFTKAGTFKYFCGLHPKMQGSVVVK